MEKPEASNENSSDEFIQPIEGENHDVAPSYWQYEIIMLVNYVVICTLLCFFGIAANVINIIVFLKQGFSFSMNISLLGLAIADLSYLFAALHLCILVNPLLRHGDIPFDSAGLSYLIAGVPGVCFGRVSGWITVFITAERCLGIATPLKVKQIITHGRTKAIIIIIFFVNIASNIPEYFNVQLVWKFFPERNTTILYLTESQKNTFTPVLSALIGYLSFIGVTIFTIILVVKLNQKSAWRQEAVSANERSAAVNKRDQRTVKLVAFIATVTIACNIPSTIVIIFMVRDPEIFQVVGPHRIIFVAVWSFPYIFQTLNASVNIFLYYRMSTKYRQTFQDMLSKYIKFKETPSKVNSLINQSKL